MHTVTQLLTIHQHLDIPDNVHNWLASYFNGHLHCTRYGGLSSALQEISAGIIQGSGVEPAGYVVNSSDLSGQATLCANTPTTHLMIPSASVDTRIDELANVGAWSQRNRLTLNCCKSVEIIVADRRRKRDFQPPPLLPNISRVESSNVLGASLYRTVFQCANTSAMSLCHVRKVITPTACQLARFT